MCSSMKFITIFQASSGSVVRCGMDGEYIYPNPWPQCSEDINCGDPLPIQVNDPRLTPTAPPGSRTWIVGTEGDDYYKAKVGYTIACYHLIFLDSKYSRLVIAAPTGHSLTQPEMAMGTPCNWRRAVSGESLGSHGEILPGWRPQSLPYCRPA